MLYQAQGLKMISGGRVILDIDNLEISAGAIYALLGANGAGKTTLLNILGFLEPPTSGFMAFNGSPVRFTAGGMQKLRREVVMVDQHPILFSTTVYKNIEFGLKIRKIDKVKRAKIIDEVLDLVGLHSFKKAFARQLSGGETQRLALARALALSPSVLLCDEPTSSVDAENQAAIITILKQINKSKNVSVIFTTHDRLQSAVLAEHTLVLDSGRLVPANYENVFSCKVDSRDDTHVRLLIQNSIHLFLPVDQVNVEPEKERVFIDPEKIDIVKKKGAVAADGSLLGRVIQLTAEGDKVRVVVNAGLMFSVLLDFACYRTRHLGVGEEVFLCPAPGAVHFI